MIPRITVVVEKRQAQKRLGCFAYKLSSLLLLTVTAGGLLGLNIRGKEYPVGRESEFTTRDKRVLRDYEVWGFDTVKREFGWPFMMCREYGIKDSKSRIIPVLLWGPLEVGYNVVTWILIYTFLIGVFRFSSSRLMGRERNVEPQKQPDNSVSKMRDALLSIIEMPDDTEAAQRMREIAKDALESL